MVWRSVFIFHSDTTGIVHVGGKGRGSFIRNADPIPAIMFVSCWLFE